MVQGLPDVEAFAEGSDRPVRALVLKGQDASAVSSIGPNVGITEGDLTDAESLQNFFAGADGATVFHCAGLIHPRRRVKEFYDVNLLGTENIIAAARAAGVKRFVHVSSNSPIGTNPHPDHRFDEKSPYNPYMHYGRSKKLAEDRVNEASTAGGLETVIIRPPWFYGPDQPARQTRFFHMIRDGKAPIVGSGENRRSMAYVDNICQGLMLCEKVEAAKGRTYWIADNEAYTMNQIVDTIEALLEEEFGVKVAHKRMRLPGIASEVALMADRIIQGVGLYNTEMHVLSEMNKTIACSIQRARDELGYDPKVGLREGMRRSIGWMKEQGIEL